MTFAFVSRHFPALTLMAASLASPHAFAQTTDAAVPPVSTVVAPAPNAAADPENTLLLDLSTGGRVTIQLYPTVAPGHVERIKTLTRQGFYNGVLFHRVIPGFMAQTGDPTGTGAGDSDLPDLKSEFSTNPHLRGTVSMARTDQSFDTANSQFFICFQPRFALDKKYTVFGRVISGMQYVDAIAEGEPPASPDKVVQASIAADNLPSPDFSKMARPVVAAPTVAPGDTPVSVEDLGN